MNDEAQQGRNRRRWAGGLIALAAAVLVAGCTAPADDAVETVVVSTVAVAVAAAGSTQAQPTAQPSSPVVVPPLSGGSVAGTSSSVTSSSVTSSAPGSGTTSASETTSSTVATTPTATTPPKPKPKPTVVRTYPKDGAVGVSPLGQIKVVAGGGTLQYVGVTTPDGRRLSGGGLNRARTTWTLVPELGYDRTYTVDVTAKAKDGTVTRTSSSFTTTPANHMVNVVANVPRGGQTVGIGQPIVITFDREFTDPADRRKVEAAVTIRTSSKQSGKFRWFTDRELHWRPINYWKPGATVDVDVDIYGKNFGNDDTYGGSDLAYSFKVGRSMVAEVDAKTHTMVIKANGKVVAKWPVSLGNDKYPTYNGVHIVQERYPTKVMDSRTWGLTGVGAYRTKVKWATRISASGEFVHAAPWSVWAQGSENVSHGCINVSDERAKWFYDRFIPGDPVIVKKSSGPQLQPWDGYGDWQIPAAKY